jgi:hypothetical protein
MLYCSFNELVLHDITELLGTDLAVKILRNGKYARITSALENGISVIGKILFTNPHFRGEWILSVRFIELLNYKGHFTLKLKTEQLTELSQFEQRIDLQEKEFFLAIDRKKSLLIDSGFLHKFMEH